MAHLELGTVVHHEENEEGHAERGVVIWSNGRGIQGHLRCLAEQTYVIQMVPGIYVVGNAVSEWTPVPEGEWTAPERVLCASCSWEWPSWKDDDPDALNESDEFGFAILRALLPASAVDQVFNDYHFPMSYEELGIAVAEWLEDTMRHQRALGAALAR